jgi:putative acetyltransferase
MEKIAGGAEMETIRPAEERDLCRIAEIEVFNYRLQFYPIFRDDAFYFREMQTTSLMERNRDALCSIFVYDDGAVKGFIWVEDGEIQKLFVEPVLQNRGIGGQLLEYAVQEQRADRLWALEKNTRAIHFYECHGFHLTGEKKPEEDTTENLVRMKRSIKT